MVHPAGERGVKNVADDVFVALAVKGRKVWSSGYLTCLLKVSTCFDEFDIRFRRLWMAGTGTTFGEDEADQGPFRQTN